MKKIGLIFYYFIFSKLPNSSFPLGKLFNQIRILVLKNIINLGSGCKIQRNVYIGNGQNISIGNNCQLNDNIRIVNISIGNDVMIARDCIFLGRIHLHENLSIPMIDQGSTIGKQTVIEDDVWVGARVIVMPGLRLAKGSIVGAGAVLTKDTEAYGIYGGIPAKLIKKRS